MDEAWEALGAATGDAAAEWALGLGYNKSAPDEVVIRLLQRPGAGWRDLVFLYSRKVSRGVVDAAISHPNHKVRLTAAESGNLTAGQWDRLIAATVESHARRVLTDLREDLSVPPSRGRMGIGSPPHPDAVPPATPAEIAEWAAAVEDISEKDVTFALWWVAALHADPEAMRQLAASPKLWVRRSVARAQHLPPDVVDRLARDEDRVVRLFLTESCDDATSEVLLDVWSWWHGSFSFPGRPRDHPNFPKTGLLRHADHPDPRWRLLALADEASTPELVDRFADDPDPAVRREAAGDPRISPAALVRLLLDERHARVAAGNPSIPVPVMHAMIDLAEQATTAPAD